jgi:hypothetical protein
MYLDKNEINSELQVTIHLQIQLPAESLSFQRVKSQRRGIVKSHHVFEECS